MSQINQNSEIPLSKMNQINQTINRINQNSKNPVNRMNQMIQINQNQ